MTLLKKVSELNFLLKHSSIYGVGVILSQLIGFILLPLYTNYLTPADYGVLQLVDLTTGMLGIVVGIGVSLAFSRFYYEYTNVREKNEVVSSTYISISVLSGASLLGLSYFSEFFATHVLDNSEYKTIFQYSFLALFLGLVLDVGQIYLRLLHKSTIYLGVSILSLVIGISLNIYFIVYAELGVLGIMYSSVITKLIIGIPITAVIIKRVGFRFKLALVSEMLRYSMPLIPSTLATQIVNYSDRYFIKYFISISDAGIYALSNKIGTAIHMLITSPFLMTFLPRRFEIAEDDDVKDTFSLIYNYYTILITYAALTVSIFSYEIMYFMTAESFQEAALYVPFIALSMVIFGMKYHFEFGILYKKKTKYYLYVNIITMVVHLALNFIFIKMYGLWGAISASLIAVTLNTILIYLVSQKLYKIEFKIFKSITIVCIAMGTYILGTQAIFTDMLNTILYKIILLIMFIPTLYMFNIISRDEIMQLISWAMSKNKAEK